MREEILAHLDEYLKQYRGRDFALAYILSVLRNEITTWLYEKHLDIWTWTRDEQTLLAIAAMCDAGMKVN